MKQNKKRRIPLVNGKYLLWTLLILVGELVLLCGAYALGLFDNFIGYILLPFLGLFTLYTAYEAAVLALEAVSVSADGIVVAGKDGQGTTIHFELQDLMGIYPCDQKGNRISENQSKYQNICLAFHMKNGKKKIRSTTYITQKQIDRLRSTLGVGACEHIKE